MPSTALETKILDGITTRLTIPQMKKAVYDENVLGDMIILAKSGLRRRLDDNGKHAYDDEHNALYDSVSTKDLIDVQKFLVSRILPPCKDHAEPDEGYAKWQAFTEAHTAPVSELSPDVRRAKADEARRDAIAGVKGGVTE